MIANSVTVSRILFSLCLFVLSPFSVAFKILYLLCGLTDILDGFLARKLHTESRVGELLDSLADLFFAAAFAAKMIPTLSIPGWIWVWTGWIAVVKIVGILWRSNREHRFRIVHSRWNKVTGLLLFLLPLTVSFTNVGYAAAVVCASATFAVIEEWLRCGESK